MSEWKQKTLGEITDWFSGGTPSKQNEEFWNGSIPWISARTLKGTRISQSEITITEAGLTNGSRMAQKDDLLLLVRGSGLFNSIPIAIVESPVAFNQDIKAIRIKDKFDYISPWFLLYWLHGNTRILNGIMEETGIGAGKFDLKLLKDLVIEIPSEEEVKDITRTIKAIDDKISLLRQQNQTLEELAQNLFKRWFVDFEFPNEDGQPYRSSGGRMVDSELGEIPEGWRVVRLSEIAGVKTGPFGSALLNEQYIKGGTPVITVEHITDFRIVELDYPSVNDADKERLSAYTLEEGDIVFSRVGSVDLSAMVQKDNEGWLFSSRMLRVRPKRTKIDPVFLSYYLRLYGVRSYIKNIAVGSTMPSINTEILKSIPIQYCDLETQRPITQILSNVETKITRNRQQIQSLTRLCDTLLPKLMSGELRVKTEA